MVQLEVEAVEASVRREMKSPGQVETAIFACRAKACVQSGGALFIMDSNGASAKAVSDADQQILCF